MYGQMLRKYRLARGLSPKQMVSRLHRNGCRITVRRYLLLEEDRAELHVLDVLAAARSFDITVSELLQEEDAHKRAGWSG